MGFLTLQGSLSSLQLVESVEPSSLLHQGGESCGHSRMLNPFMGAAILIFGKRNDEFCLFMR